MSIAVNNQSTCYHCGEACREGSYMLEEKQFCCEGCRTVFQLLNEHGLCDYYDLNSKPGKTLRMQVRKDKFAWLDDEKMAANLVSFRNGNEVHASFYLPHIHCSSCLYLLENLHRIHEGVKKCTVHFTTKEIDIVSDSSRISIREVAELLTSVGYEPYISLNDMKGKKPRLPRTMIYQLGVAGFCFGNIMLLSFPEYLGLENAEKNLQFAFRYISLALSIPVLLFSAQPFYISAFKSLRHGWLNIDAPIVLAIWVTFLRSLLEVLTGTGSGYFDSFSGIVFFMLIGRVLQDKTFLQLSFERDYTSYFPVAATVMKQDRQEAVALPDIRHGDTLLIHNGELVPADGILTRGKALIDYSFVTGESLPVVKEMGEIIYAGGKQTGGNIELLVVKEVAQSYLTGLWNRVEKNPGREKEGSFVHHISRWFTYVVFAIAALTTIYWAFVDAARILPAVTAVLIVACPCALLLANTFTNGHVLRILARNKLYLRNASVIEDIAEADHIIFDKTGTLTSSNLYEINFEGKEPSPEIKHSIAALAAQSVHPLSKALSKHLGSNGLQVQAFRELTGLGIEGLVNGDLYAIGSCRYITGRESGESGTRVYVSRENQLLGSFLFRSRYRNSVQQLLKDLQPAFGISVLSGDNASERKTLQQMSVPHTHLLFNQKPQDKLEYVRQLKEKGQKVMMIGDGLNDAVALKESNVGIAVADEANTFTPASDGILQTEQLGKLLQFIRLCRYNRQIVMASFVMSIVYNIVGLYFAVQGILSPLIAAILMPASSISIILLTFATSQLAAARLKLLK